MLIRTVSGTRAGKANFELVKLNLQNPAVSDYLLECVKQWIEQFDIDGLRLDVATV